MYGAIEIVADCRREEYLADAARERLAKQARPTQPLASQSREVLGSALRALHASARGVWVALSLRTVDASDNARETVLLTPAR